MSRQSGAISLRLLAISGAAAAFITVVVLTSGSKTLLQLEEDQFEILQKPGTLQIFFLDVNQASSTLIVTPSRQHAILIDAGNTAAGRKLILPLLERLEEINGVSPPQIDLMFITHYDSDHIGGADEVLNGYTVAELYDHGDHEHWKAEKNTNALRDYITAGQSIVETIPLDFDRTIDGVRIRCLASNGKTRFDPPDSAFGADEHDDNPNSVALLISYEGFDLYIAGDQTGNTEARLVGQTLDGHNLDVDVYHMNHHGSSTHGSSSPEFLDMLSPEVAIASNGSHKTFKHPHPDPVNHLLAAGTQVFLLNQNEHSEISLDAKFISDDEPKGYEGTLVIVVGPQDGHYHVLLAGMPVVEATYPIEQ